MPQLKVITAVVVLFMSMNFGTAQNKPTGTGVEVYYFHATNRCVTCNAVESVTKEALQQYYSDRVSFQSINREEDKSNPLVKKHQISGQTLLVTKGEKTVNLTNFAFMNARTKPEKLKAKIKETIDKM